MKPRVWAALGCLLVGVPVAAWGLANGSLLLGLLGLALVLVFIFLVVEAMNHAAKPKHEIPKAPNAAWAMKDQPADSRPNRGTEGSL